MRNAGSVVTRERLIDEVWDPNWFGSTKTLDVHVSGIRRKLGDDPSEPRYLHTVRGVGFRFSSPDEVVSLRLRLLAAFAYVLLLIIVALEVPLALNLAPADRRRGEERGRRRRRSSSRRRRRAGWSTRSSSAQVARSAGSDLGARVIVVDARAGACGRTRPSASRAASVRRSHGRRSAPRSAAAAPRASGTATRSARTCSTRRCR